jgi:hypothetical protein
MAALQQCDQYQRLRGLSIFENMEQQKSWAETILTGNRIIRTHHTWNRHDIDVLLGLHTIDENWGLLGNMGARGNAANTLNENKTMYARFSAPYLTYQIQRNSNARP